MKVRKCTIIFLVSIFCFMLGMNVLTPLVCDDYSYSFSFANFERITNVGDIIESLQVHYNTMNGRLITHFFVHLMLMLPDWLFDILNSLMVVVYILLIRFYCKKNTHLLVAAGAFSFVMYFMPNLGQVFFWLDGSCNYLWVMVFVLLYLIPYKNYFEEKGEINKTWVGCIYVIISFLMGDVSESGSLMSIFGAIGYVLLIRFYKKKKLPWFMYLAIIAQCVGYYFMINAPGLSANHRLADRDLGIYIQNFLTVLVAYKDYCMILFCVWIILMVCSVVGKIELVYILNSVLFAVLSLATNFAHVFAIAYPPRSMLACVTCLVIANAILLSVLFNSEHYKVMVVSICLIISLASVVDVLPGVYDVYRMHCSFVERETIIVEQKEAGNKNVVVPNIYPSSKYSAMKDLDVLSSTDATFWVNSYTAKYYELDSLLGE